MPDETDSVGPLDSLLVHDQIPPQQYLQRRVGFVAAEVGAYNEPEELKRVSRLVFDTPEQVRDILGGRDPVDITDAEAEALVGKHLWNEEGVNVAIEAANRSGSGIADPLRVIDVLEVVRRYRHDEDLELQLPPGQFEDRMGVDSVAAGFFVGVDLANQRDVLKEIANTRITPPEVLDDRIKQYVQERVDLDLKIKNPGPWNQEIKVVLADMSEKWTTFKGGVRSGWDKIREADRRVRQFSRKMGEFRKSTVKAGKDSWSNVNLKKDSHELVSILSRGVWDVVPELGLAIAAGNMFAMGLKEVRTIQKIAKSRPRDAWTFAEYFRQTTLGKVTTERRGEKLTKKQKRLATAVGVAASLTGSLLAGIATQVKVPGLGGIARSALIRGYFNYLVPRTLDSLSKQKLVEGGLLPEDAQKAWFNQALDATAATNKVTMALFMTDYAFSTAETMDPSQVEPRLDQASTNIEAAVDKTIRIATHLDPEDYQEAFKEMWGAGTLGDIVEAGKDAADDALLEPYEHPGKDEDNTGVTNLSENSNIDPDLDLRNIPEGVTLGQNGQIESAVTSDGEELLMDYTAVGNAHRVLLEMHLTDEDPWTVDEVVSAVKNALQKNQSLKYEDLDEIKKP